MLIRAVFVASGRVELTVLVFLTTTGGTDCPRELMDELGRAIWELGGPCIRTLELIDGVLLWLVWDAKVSVFDIRLERREGCLIGCLCPGSGFEVVTV